MELRSTLLASRLAFGQEAIAGQNIKAGAPNTGIRITYASGAEKCPLAFNLRAKNAVPIFETASPGNRARIRVANGSVSLIDAIDAVANCPRRYLARLGEFITVGIDATCPKPAPDRVGTDQITLLIRWREWRTGRIASDPEIDGRHITEERIGGDVSFLTELTLDTPDPVATRVAIDIAACEDGACRPAAGQSLTHSAKGDDRPIQYCVGIPQVNRSGHSRRIAVEGAINERRMRIVLTEEAMAFASRHGAVVEGRRGGMTPDSPAFVVCGPVLHDPAAVDVDNRSGDR